MKTHKAHNTALIALGGNLGSPQETFNAACKLLNASGTITARSRVYISKPWGFEDQPDFHNAAIALQAKLPPQELIVSMQQVEAQLGKTFVRENGPRVIDLDLILQGHATCNTSLLQLPHPRYAQRDFVLRPLMDIAPQSICPTSGQSIAQLYSQLSGGTLIHTILPWQD